MFATPVVSSYPGLSKSSPAGQIDLLHGGVIIKNRALKHARIGNVHTVLLQII